MGKRFVSIWFRYLQTDWITIRQANLHGKPLVLAAPDHGRMIIAESNPYAQKEGIDKGMAVADARAICPTLNVLNHNPALTDKLLKKLANWFIRYTPIVSIDEDDGLVLDATGCSHLWGGEETYITDIINRLKNHGYIVQVGLADTIGAAWALARYNNNSPIIESGKQLTALLDLPSMALRLNNDIIERLQKLGLRKIKSFINMPRQALRRRFGPLLLQRLDEAIGNTEEFIISIQPVPEYEERLPCIEPIATATGIEIALERVITQICNRLKKEEKGLRSAIFRCYRVDGKIEQIQIGTNRGTNSVKHIFKLFENKIAAIEPALGIDMFILEAQGVEEVTISQESLWGNSPGLDNVAISELLDRIAGRIGSDNIARFVPDEHYWPERSIKRANSFHEAVETTWRRERPRPLQLINKPEPIEVTAPIPDYPPMNFRYNSKFHKVIKADGPERIEAEWWIEQGQHRDYYIVEDEEGNRYWLFRLGHYDKEKTYQWFLHGFFS